MNVCLILALAASLSAACRGETPERQEQKGGTVIEEDHMVFDAVASSDPAVCWNAGDEILIADAEGQRAVYKASAGGREVRFVYSSGSRLAPGSTYTAWSPSSAADGAVPPVQTVAQDVLHDIPMTARSESSRLEFAVSANLVKVRVEGQVKDLCAISLGGKVQINIPETLSDVSSGRTFRVAMPDGAFNPMPVGVLAASGGCGAFSLPGIVVRSGSEPEVTVSLQQLRSSVNLSANGAANCYIAGGNGAYRLYSGGKGAAVLAQVLWEQSARGNSSAVSCPILYNNYVYFCKGISDSSPFVASNAVIGISDNSGRILWSWHIWSPAETASDGSGMVDTYDSGKAMDRNLGALSKTPGDTLSRGLYYQWGRKDPFPLWRDGRFPAAERTDAVKGTAEYAGSHPMTFILGVEETCFDWSYAVQDTTVWRPLTGAKGEYDPCPPGWRVPDGAGQGVFGIGRGNTKMVRSGFWALAFGTSLPFRGVNSDGSGWWNQGKCGMTVPSSVSGRDSWFPATGYIDAETGGVVSRFEGGSLWTRGSEPVRAAIPACSHCMVYGAGGLIRPTSFSGRAAGMNVRCVKE